MTTIYRPVRLDVVFLTTLTPLEHLTCSLTPPSLSGYRHTGITVFSVYSTTTLLNTVYKETDPKRKFIFSVYYVRVPVVEVHVSGRSPLSTYLPKVSKPLENRTFSGRETQTQSR